MATAADDSTACGGGAGGKFRKRPFRRPQTTPYDRTPAALRITRRNNDTTTGGWLSRIVNPASKLITTSAHKLFSSVFRKRLLPPPPPSQDEKAKPSENHLEDTVTGPPYRIQERDMIEGNTQNGGCMTDGVAELEHILNQKTFTRSEIDRLTVLLHSRTVDKVVAEGQERFELTPSEPSTVHSRQTELQVTAFGNGVNVDVALPTELAKAYMGGRSTRVSPSTLGQQSEAVGEKTPAITALTLPRPNVSTVQNPISPAGTFQKDFVVPRLRGRSAIYSMARTPYSSVRPTLTKGLGTKNDAFDDHSLLSSQKVLKRRCSVLENDIGAIGPIRRIRQKPNLMYPKPLDLPSSGTPSSGSPFTTNATISGVGEPSSSKSHEDRGEKGGPFSSLHVSSKSVEMGQRILQNLHKLTPPKENSIEKKTGFAGGISGLELTPAMLHGQARKSLETVDLLKYVQHDKVCRKMESSDDLHEAEHSKFYDSNSKVLLNSPNKVYSENGEARITVKDGVLITKDTASVVITSAIDVPKRSPAFQMSAYEDFLDMEDDAQLNVVASSSVNEGKTDLSAASSMQSNGKLPGQGSFSEATKAHIPSFTGTESSSDSALIKNTTVESSNTAEKGIISSFSSNSHLNKTSVFSTASTSVPDKADIHASTISFGLKSLDKVSPLSFITSPVMESSMTKDVTSRGFAFADAAIKSPGFNNKSTEAVDLSKQAVNSSAYVPESSTSTLSSLDSCPLVSAAPSPVLCSFQSLSSGSAALSTLSASNTGANATKAGASAADSTATNGSSNSLASSVAFPSFQPTFSGSSATSDSLTMATLDTDPAGKSKTDLGTTQGSAYLNFQFRSPTTSSTDSQLQASHNGSSGSIFIDQVLVSTSTSTSTAENISNQAAASALPVLSGSSSLPVISGPLTSVSAPLSSSFIFGSSSAVATSGSSSSASVAALGSASSASTEISGGSLQPINSPGFGSALNNSSSGLSFGTSSAPENGSSAGSSSSLSSRLIFGAASPPSSSVSSGTSSINGSSNGVPFGASSTSAPSGSTSSVFGYGASSSASSGAPSLTFPFTASSAPATTTTTTITPSSTFSFGLVSAAPASLTAPPSTFSFGASSAPASSGAPSSTFSFGASSTSAASSGAPSSTFSFGASLTSASSSAPSSTFSFGASSAPSSTFSFGASSTSASSSAPFSTFSFGGSSASASSSSAPSSPFSFGASSASVTATPAPVFPFGSGAPTPAASTVFQSSQLPAFGNNASSVFGFGSNLSPSPLGNNDQMNMEDTMLEDSMQSPPTAATPTPVFGQTPTSNFSFGMAQGGASPFQFASQQNQAAAPPNSFQASGSFDGGSFSLGAGGNDKSNRRIVKVKGKNRKK